MNTVRILVTDGGVAEVIREELGSRCPVSKVHYGDPDGCYGDFIFRQLSNSDAVMMKLKYPQDVHIL